MVVSYLDVEIGKPRFFQRSCKLPQNQVNILFHIALIGPNDAYRINRELKSSLSTTQLAFKKLNAAGIIQLKETAKGETDQIRKIYCLTHYGFCLVATIILVDGSQATYEQLRSFIDLNSDLFPELLKRWDFLVNHSREYYSQNPVNDWKNLNFLISLPDISTEIWYLILLKTCQNVIDDHSWGEEKEDPSFNLKTVNEKSLNDKLEEVFDSCISGYLTSPWQQGFIYAIKQDKKLCANLVPVLSNLLVYHEKQVKLLKKTLDEIK